MLGDFHARHTAFGNKHKNIVEKSLINLINQGKIIHLGPDFLTFFSHNSTTNPEKIFLKNNTI